MRDLIQIKLFLFMHTYAYSKNREERPVFSSCEVTSMSTQVDRGGGALPKECI